MEPAADPYADPSKPNPNVQLPAYGNLNGISVGQVSPIFGVSNGNGPDYLDYDTKGRGLTERMFYNSGMIYIGGLGLGGMFGALEGLKNAPKKRFKIRLNSVLNACGKRGSRVANALGVLAIMYTGVEGLADYLEADKLAGGIDIVNPIIAGAGAGALYKCTKGPGQMALFSAVGAIGMAGFSVGNKYFAQQYGNASRFGL